MIDREKVLAVLRKRFPGAPVGEMAAAANAIMGLPDEWEDVSARDGELGYHASSECRQICFLADEIEQGLEFRLFRKRGNDLGH